MQQQPPGGRGPESARAQDRVQRLRAPPGREPRLVPAQAAAQQSPGPVLVRAPLPEQVPALAEQAQVAGSAQVPGSAQAAGSVRAGVAVAVAV